MATIAPKPQSVSFTPAPAGTHVARVFKFMNLGTRYQEYKGEKKAYPDTLVNFSLELPNELNKFTYLDKETNEEVEVEKPFAISREFTLSMGKKSNLRPFVEGIIGVALTDEEAYNFDLEQLVGKVCLVTVVHKKSQDGERTFANIASTSPLVKGMEEPTPVNDTVIQDVNVMSKEEIEALPDWLRDKMVISDEYKDRFDPSEAERKQGIQNQIDELRGVGTSSSPEEEITESDIPF